MIGMATLFFCCMVSIPRNNRGESKITKFQILTNLWFGFAYRNLFLQKFCTLTEII